MIPVLDWIFEGVTNWVASVVAQLMDAVSGLFLNALGTDMTAMEEYFPFVAKAYDVLQYTSWAVLLLIVGWQLFRVFGGPITEAENPWHLLIRGALAAFLIGYAKPIFVLILDITTAPYTALMEVSMTGEDFTFAGVEQALQNGLTTIVSLASIVGVLLLLILEIAIGWNYFKLLLETVERYVVVGVLCYTAPLAFCMAGSKATSQVFKSWCRMVGSQMILLVMNVWFLRGFASSMGHFIGNGGALTNGNGSVFLWAFCALAYLKCAQRFDSYLSSIGMSVAQTGSSMGMELVMAARAITGAAGSAGKGSGGVIQRGINSLFGNGTPTATGTGAAAAGFASAFTSKFKPNTYVRDAVVEGGTRAGVSGGAGFVARAFGGMAARNGAVLTGGSISTVASRAPNMSGMIGGEIANRSLQNYMPQFGGFQLKDTQISGGHISTTAVSPDGKKTSVDMYSASQYEKPHVPHRVVTASDGSQWYQMASGENLNEFYGTQHFSGAPEEAAQVAAAFPDTPEGTTLRTVGDGMLEANTPDGNSMWYNSAFFEEPDAPHSTIQSSDGVEWYAMKPHAEAPAFDGVDGQQTVDPAGMSDGLLQNGEAPVDGIQTGMAQYPDFSDANPSNSSFELGTDQMDPIVQPTDVPVGETEISDVSDMGQGMNVEVDAEDGQFVAPVENAMFQDGTSQFAHPDGMSLPGDLHPIGNDDLMESDMLHTEMVSDDMDLPQNGLYQNASDLNMQAQTGMEYGNHDGATEYPVQNEEVPGMDMAINPNDLAQDSFYVSMGMPDNSDFVEFRDMHMPAGTVVADSENQGETLLHDAEVPSGGMAFSQDDHHPEMPAPAMEMQGASVSGFGDRQMDHPVQTDGMPVGGMDQNGSVHVGVEGYQDGSIQSEGTPAYRGEDIPNGGNTVPIMNLDQSSEYELSDHGQYVVDQEMRQAPSSNDLDMGAIPVGRSDHIQMQQEYGFEDQKQVRDDVGNDSQMVYHGTDVGSYSGGDHEVHETSDHHSVTAQQNHPTGYPETIAPSANQVQTGTDSVDVPQLVQDHPEAQTMYNRAVFQNFMPGYDQTVTQVDGSQRGEGRINIRHEDGSGMAFFDTTRYAPPRGDYRVFEDSKGRQWYAIRGDAAVDRKPVYEDGKPVYDGDKLRTVNVETVRYKNTPAKFSAPKLRQKIEPQKPKRKN